MTAPQDAVRAALADDIERRATNYHIPPFDDLIEENWKIIVAALRASPPSLPHGGEPVASLQSRVLPWLLQCFGPDIPCDKQERNHRFLEEALELVQACGCTQSEAQQLVDYVYGRDQGDINQEVGGVMITLAALCIANGFDMHNAGETELARIWTMVEKIRAKQVAKPKHSPLPALTSPPATALDDGGVASRVVWAWQITITEPAENWDMQPPMKDRYTQYTLSDQERRAIQKALLDSGKHLYDLATPKPHRDAVGIKPHIYSPDYQAMGDCRVCGHGQDKPWHDQALTKTLSADRDAIAREALQSAQVALEAALEMHGPDHAGLWLSAINKIDRALTRSNPAGKGVGE